MRYEQIASGATYPYPENNIDPAKKGREWCMQYAKAAFADFSFGVPKGVLANNNGDYEKFRMYALGKQPNSQYKKWLGVDEATDNTWMSIDWSIRPIATLYRDRVISRMMKEEHGIVATPIDMLAKTEMQEYYGRIKAKLAIREMLQQQGADPELQNHPMLSMQAGEPMDVEELEMRVLMGEQFNRSRDAELAIQYGFEQNGYKYKRKKWFEDLFDLGVGGYKEWMENGRPMFRVCNPDNVVVSFCREANFSDAVHAGELISVSLIDLAALKDEEGNPLFTEDELKEFAGTVLGKWGNPKTVGVGGRGLRPYDKFKAQVLDIEFYSYNDYVYRNTKDENGNVDFRRAEYHRKSDKYIRKRFKVVYKCKWIVGTDKCYDWGLVTDMKRSNMPEYLSDTSLSYKFCATNFYEMKATGMMERLIPHIDNYMLTQYKIQNFKNRAVPSGWWMDLDALENVALNKGGKNMEPKEILQMFFETGVLLGRSKDAAGNPMSPNWKPVIPIENTAASELAMLYQDLVATIQEMEKIVGYNDITSGNPNPKTLVPGYELANQSTQDALYPIAAAETYLSECLAYDVLRRTQQAIKAGYTVNYSNALNINTIRAFEISPDIAFREYGIMLEKKTTEQEKMWLLQQMQGDIANGFLDSSDAALLVNTHNVKQAQIIWAYKVKKNKQMMQQNEMQKIQLNNQGAKEAAAIAQEQATMQQQMMMQFELQKKQMELQAELMKEKMKIESMERIALQNNMTKLEVSGNEGSAKVEASARQAEAKVESQFIAAQAAIEKQEIANEKPANTEKK